MSPLQLWKWLLLLVPLNAIYNLNNSLSLPTETLVILQGIRLNAWLQLVSLLINPTRIRNSLIDFYPSQMDTFQDDLIDHCVTPSEHRINFKCTLPIKWRSALAMK